MYGGVKIHILAAIIGNTGRKQRKTQQIGSTKWKFRLIERFPLVP